MKTFVYIIFIFVLLASCSGFKEAGKVLRNEKIKTTDEFLVKNKNPLILPPNYEEIPKPGSIKKDKSESEKIKKILKVPKSDKISKSKSSSIEKSILDKINK